MGRRAMLALLLLHATHVACDEPALFTESDVNRINRENRTWRAAYYPWLKNITFLATPEPKAGHHRRASSTADPAFVPSDFDLRDVAPGEPPCRALDEVQDQRGFEIGGMYATTTAFAANLCLSNNRTSRANTLTSIQQMVDCTGAAYTGGSTWGVNEDWVSGGSPICSLASKPTLGVNTQCSYDCSPGLSYAGLGGAQWIPVELWQTALVKYGVLVARFEVSSAFLSYQGGIFQADNSMPLGGQVAALAGWGVDNGVPYWLIQNAWGTAWGEKGFARLLRGADTMGIERWGAYVIQPAPVTACPGITCPVGTAHRSDCTCDCTGTLRSGSMCQVCPITCLNGGAANARCAQCECVPGYWGPACEHYVRTDTTASVAGDGSVIRFTWKQGARLTAGSIFALYAPSNTTRYSSSSITRASLCATSQGPTYCADTGTLFVGPPTAPGTYDMYVMLSDTDLGPGSFYPVGHPTYSIYMGQYIVVANSTQRPAALQNSGPLALMAAAAAERASQASVMNARLALRRNTSDLFRTATVWFPGYNETVPRIWIPTPSPARLCYSLPPQFAGPQAISVEGFVLATANGPSSACTNVTFTWGHTDGNHPIVVSANGTDRMIGRVTIRKRTPNATMWLRGFKEPVPRIVLGTAKTTLCYELRQPEFNMNPKSLRLYLPDATWYEQGVFMGVASVPASASACFDFTFSAGIPAANYTIVMNAAKQPLLRAAVDLRKEMPAVWLTRPAAPRPRVWLGTKERFCWSLAIPNTPKTLRWISSANIASTAWVSIPGATAPTANTSGCFEITLAPTAAAGNYSIALAATLFPTIIGGITLDAGRAEAYLNGTTDRGPIFEVNATWSISPAHASPRDQVRVVAINNASDVAGWFYTSTRSQAPPGNGTAASLTGTIPIRIAKATASRSGGYRAEFRPEGGPLTGVTRANSINWTAALFICQPGTFGTLGVCTAASPGSYSADGFSQWPCPAGTISPSAGRSQCQACPLGTNPSASRTSCAVA